jgi:hypothetical protein
VQSTTEKVDQGIAVVRGLLCKLLEGCHIGADWNGVLSEKFQLGLDNALLVENPKVLPKAQTDLSQVCDFRARDLIVTLL